MVIVLLIKMSYFIDDGNNFRWKHCSSLVKSLVNRPVVLAIVFHCLGHSKNVYDDDDDDDDNKKV